MDDTIALILIFVAALIAAFIAWLVVNASWTNRIVQEREAAIKKSGEVRAGQFAEQIAPYLPDFPFNPADARFIGKPIDFIIFRGASEKEIEEVVFVEVKSGKARISTQEKRLRDVINEKKVSWYEYRAMDAKET